MKNFFKKTWWIFVGLIVGLIFIFLSPFSPVCLIIGLFIVGVMLIVVSVFLKKRYNRLKQEYENDDNIFDATKYDYDEDVYIIGTKPKLRTQIKQGLFSKVSALGPCLLTGIFGAGFIFLAITFVIRLIL